MIQKIVLPWDDIRTVFLDMDGTLLDLHFDNHFWQEHLPLRLAEQRRLPIEQAKAMVVEQCAEIEGTLDWYCLDYWSSRLDMDIVALKHEVADRIGLRAYVEEFLEHLHRLNQRVVLLTNAHQESVRLKFAYVEMEHYFDRVITSHAIGVAKEHVDFWSKLTEIDKFDPQNSLFIDDNLHVLRRAKLHGVRHLLAVRVPDSKQAPKNTEEFVAIDCYTQLM